MSLNFEEQRIAGTGCVIEKRGTEEYCFTHHCQAKNDRCCLDAEEIVEQVIKARARRMSERRGYPW